MAATASRPTFSDAAGNAAPGPATQAIAIDETAPSIAITAPVAGDNIINKAEAAAGVTISGTATAGSAAVNGQTATITIVDSTNAVKDTYTATVNNGTWSVNVTAAQAQGLADGSYTSRPTSPMPPAMRPRPRPRPSPLTRPRPRSRSPLRSQATTSSTRPKLRLASPSAARQPLAAPQSTARLRPSRSSTAPMRSRTPIRRRSTMAPGR